MLTPSRLRPLMLVAFALSGALSATGAAADDLTRSFDVGVGACDAAGFAQLCTPVPSVALPTDGVFRVAFDASINHCSAIIAHVLVDGVERFASGALPPGQSTGLLDFGPIAAGVHAVGVQAEGVTGGCNTGSLGSWEGTLSLTVSGITDADAAIAAPGGSVAISTAIAGSPAPAAVEATYTRPLDALGLATLAGATYIPGNPIIPGNPVLPAGSVAFVDLLLIGGTADDLVQALFVPPNPIIPGNPVIPGNPIIPGNPVRLAFWDGAVWSPVRSNAGALPTYTTGTGFSVSFTATSTPAVTNLGGTVFAFVGSYALVGFAPPVDNDAVNVAKAGRVIPLKWQLYDLGGNPIDDLAPAAVHVTSVSIACASLAQTGDAVEEYAAGASGLQNLGGGAYQFNWATSKTFSVSCRRLRLDLGEQNPDGTPFYRTADFRFTR